MSNSGRCRAVVAVSGGGSNLQAFIDAVDAGQLHLELAAVVSNRADAYGLQRASAAGIDNLCVASRGVRDRDEYDRQLAAAIDHYAPDLILLAGFMRILGKDFVEHFAGRILNIHPSLLPKFPGLDTHERALAAGEKEHGCTVHFVTEQLDGGPAISQGRVPVRVDDDGASLAQRVLAVEHKIYPHAAALFAAGRIRCRDGKAYLDSKPLEKPLNFSS
ncbi:MAG: phosphoribosylglycinamide formyltransferase [Woeseia sp.]|nr:phosphoribosylglycinamide formyltransferase [Woeseia sp.]MBT8095468.1 phosphoribosylglycinamide formyltransferase [Woeseia sp.]NNE60325.1 phosphoribosylglycinamide formyltransferase [Woeseia sp.]NNL54811.1 phosphoribosylglycinamide formyltransferase [Woeseia sp.]